jgi:hypothetical protein
MNQLIETKIRPRINALANRAPKYAIEAHYAAVREYQKKTATTNGRPATKEAEASGTAAAFEVIERFERGLEAHLAESARRRQEAVIAEQQQGAAWARRRAQDLARANPMRPSEILIAVERSGHRIRLRKGLIEVAPSTDLELALEMQIVEHKAVLSDYFRQRDDWRTIAVVPADSAKGEAL